MLPDVMDRLQKLYAVLFGVFLTGLILAEITGSKLIQLSVTETWVFTMTMGVIPFPLTFIVTDLINEYFGKPGIRFVTVVGMIMIALAYVILAIDMAIPAAAISPVMDEQFNSVFGQSNRIILGSLTAYLIGQLIDIQIFHWIRKKTHARLLWLRATGSTFASQFVDSFVVLFIAFYGTIPTGTILNIGVTNYVYKFCLAILITPLIYLAHFAIDRYLGRADANTLITHAEEM